MSGEYTVSPPTSYQGYFTVYFPVRSQQLEVGHVFRSHCCSHRLGGTHCKYTNACTAATSTFQSAGHQPLPPCPPGLQERLHQPVEVARARTTLFAPQCDIIHGSYRIHGALALEVLVPTSQSAHGGHAEARRTKASADARPAVLAASIYASHVGVAEKHRYARPSNLTGYPGTACKQLCVHGHQSGWQCQSLSRMAMPEPEPNPGSLSILQPEQCACMHYGRTHV